MASTMNPEAKAAWVAALRSGKYKQGKGRLRDDRKDAFCCLGVACDIAPAGLVEWDGSRYVYTYGPRTQCTEASILPEPVKDWLGLYSRDPYVIDPYLHVDAHRVLALSELNDGYRTAEGLVRLTFAQIADIIEAQL